MCRYGHLVLNAPSSKKRRTGKNGEEKSNFKNMRGKVKKITFFLRKSVEKIVEIYYNRYIRKREDRKERSFAVKESSGGVKSMDFKTEQDKFDQIKWFDSMKEGRDMCGTYEFCSCCKKEPTYPCARAAHRYQSGYIRIAILRGHA